MLQKNHLTFRKKGIIMKTFDISIPAMGYVVFRVQAETSENAMEQLLEGELDDTEYERDEIDLCLNSNNWTAEEVIE
jgi:hypothetical protein